MRAWHKFILPIITFFRRRRGRKILKAFPDIGSYRVLDLGGSVHFWHETGLIDRVGSVDIFNISNSEVQIQHALSDKFTIRLYDGLHLPVASSSYDLVISNSVFEHIPLHDRASVALEAMRVGKRGFIQTPAAEFPVEPHFVLPIIHWLPRRLGRHLVRISPWALLSSHPTAVQDAYWEEVQLLGRRQVETLFKGHRVYAETFLGLPKAWIATW